MKRILDLKSIVFACVTSAALLYYLKLIFDNGSFTVDSKWLFLAFVIMVMFCFAYMIVYIRRLNKTVDDMKLMVETIVENQLEDRIAAEKLHRNTRVLLLEAIAEGGSNGGNKKRIKVMGRK